MNRSTDRPPPTQAQARLIAIAILLGGFAFAVVVPIILSQSDGKGLADPPVTILTWIAAGFALVAAAAGFGLRSVMLLALGLLMVPSGEAE